MRLTIIPEQIFPAHLIICRADPKQLELYPSSAILIGYFYSFPLMEFMYQLIGLPLEDILRIVLKFYKMTVFILSSVLKRIFRYP